jgi:hypothetical protein
MGFRFLDRAAPSRNFMPRQRSWLSTEITDRFAMLSPMADGSLAVIFTNISRRDGWSNLEILSCWIW